MATRQRSVLMVGLDDRLVEEIGVVLQGGDLVAESLPDAEEALELVLQLPFDVVIVGHPLPDRSTEQFLAAVRRNGSLSRDAAVLVVTEPSLRDETQVLVGRGANRLLTTTEAAPLLQGLVAELLDVAPRLQLRVATRLDVNLEKGASRLLCQTENISATGMLVRTDQAFPPGTQVRFELTLPRDGAPVRGVAEVIRHAGKRRERVSGVGVRFRSFEGLDGERFAAKLRLLSAAEDAASQKPPRRPS